MRTYKVNGMYVEAASKDEAVAIQKALKDKAKKERIIVIRKGSRNYLISLPEGENIDIFFKTDDTVNYCGSVKGDVGHRVLQSAINSVNCTESEKAKLAAHVKRQNRKKAIEDFDKFIDDFEGTIPDSVKDLYKDTMNQIEATTIGYKHEIFLKLAEEGIEKIDKNSWLPALKWFRKNVLKGADKSDTYRLRKSFATALVKMVSGGAKASSNMRRAVDAHDDDYWSKYAEGDSGS